MRLFSVSSRQIRSDEQAAGLAYAKTFEGSWLVELEPGEHNSDNSQRVQLIETFLDVNAGNVTVIPF
jgi:hypothetical protein